MERDPYVWKEILERLRHLPDVEKVIIYEKRPAKEICVYAKRPMCLKKQYWSA
jgi:hypothetical protein